ncbi:fimbrial biogenesis chaperone [Escherichia coli]|uniref:fimbrial biogenesis chaperone n=1 Tax=Escherichia coli TaxID=562 RepID=UPI0020230395|nr:fimbria/pilus periplasmic chaperone [Escherichia coli]
MNFIKRLVLAISIMPIFAHSAIEGVTLGSTRVIYKSTDEMSVVKATNFSEKNYWLLRSWVSNYFDDQKNECFIVTPPLHRIEPNDEIQLQIKAIREEKIPDDRESLFRLNVLAIPPKTFLSTDGKEIKGHLQFAINSRIKLIYRPARIGEPYDITKNYMSINLMIWLQSRIQRLFLRHWSIFLLMVRPYIEILMRL